jgi:hypothetical protein
MADETNGVVVATTNGAKRAKVVDDEPGDKKKSSDEKGVCVDGTSSARVLVGIPII